MSKCRRYLNRVTIQRVVPASDVDAHGHVNTQVDTAWEEYTTAFCDVVSKGGREFWKVDQVTADVDHVWWTGWTQLLDAATPDMRLVWEGRTYEILAVIDVDLRHKEIQIQTRREV